MNNIFLVELNTLSNLIETGLKQYSSSKVFYEYFTSVISSPNNDYLCLGDAIEMLPQRNDLF